MIKEKYQISFSGGRTSAYMTKMLLDKYKDTYDFIVTFANTGMEHEKTLEFVKNCDVNFGFNTVWLEAKVIHGDRKSTEFKIVDFETASRKGEPFHEVIKKYGIPNTAYPHCTRELKLNPMRSYLKSIGIDHKTIKTAIGIRADEKRRISKQADVNNIVYPLIDDFPVDKQDVLDWWEDQDFDLGIEEWDGNCKGCFKKSFKKIFNQIDSEPSLLNWHIDMEHKYPKVGNKDDSFTRVFFRYNTSAKTVQQMYEEDRSSGATKVVTELYADAGCSESCEVYGTE